MEKINEKVRSCCNLNQWKNSHGVIDWFSNLKSKNRLTFLVFDIVDFYPSISQDLLIDAIDFAMQYTNISEHEKDVILHSRKSLLFDNEQPWSKRNNSSLFDVTMGSYDGAEICELVGLFILSKLNAVYKRSSSSGLYRDDGLAAFEGTGPRTADKIRKNFAAIFKETGLNITAQANPKVVNYLDITLYLNSGKYYPYRKPNNPPPSIYINTLPNHPPAIIKQLPNAINNYNRLSGLSCDRLEFEKAAPIYQNALKSSGYTEQLVFSEPKKRTPQKKRNKDKSFGSFPLLASLSKAASASNSSI